MCAYTHISKCTVFNKELSPERKEVGVGESKGGINGDRRRLELGWRTLNTIYR